MNQIVVENTVNKNKPGRPKGFSTKTKKDEPPKTKKLNIILTMTQYHYLGVLAKRKSLSVVNFVTDVIERIMDGMLLKGELEFNIPVKPEAEKLPVSESVLVLKAMVYGELPEHEKLTTDLVERVSNEVGCETEKIIKLLERIE